MDIGIACFLEEGANDLGPFENLAAAARLEQRHHVAEIAVGIER
jgi:hypothetical protein